MANKQTFASGATPEVNAGIGDQQITTGATEGGAAVLNSINRAAQIAVPSIANAIATSEGKDVAKDAMESVDKERKRREDAREAASLAEESGTAENPLANPDGTIDSTVQGVSDKAGKLAKAVDNGIMSAEDAKFHAMNAVTKAIDDKGFLSKQIRSAAEKVLGFNLESEGARQFFGSFSTEKEMAAKAAAVKQTPFQKTKANLISSGMNDDAATLTARSLLMSANNLQLLQDEVATGNIQSGRMYQERKVETIRNIDLNLVSVAREKWIAGEAVSPAMWRVTVDEIKAMDWENQRQALLTNPNGAPSSSRMAEFRADHSEAFETAYNNIENMDENIFKQEQINNNATNRTLLTDKLFEVHKLFREGLGDRTLASMMEITALGINNPAAAQLLLATQPELGPFFEYLQQNPDTLAKAMLETPKILADDSKTLSDLPEGGDAVMAAISQTVQNAPSDERGKWVQTLVNKGQVLAPVSMISKYSPENTTENNIKWYKTEFASTLATTPQAVGRAIIVGNTTSLTNRGAKLSLTPDGTQIRITQGDNFLVPNLPDGTRPLRNAVNHPAYKDVQKINQYLVAMRKFPQWKHVLGVSSLDQMTNKILSDMNQSMIARPVNVASEAAATDAFKENAVPTFKASQAAQTRFSAMSDVEKQELRDKANRILANRSK
jgi:hypothetical protein